MTRDNYQQFWYFGVILITKVDHYILFILIQKHFGGFEILPNPHDTAPLIHILSEKLALV